MKIFGHRGFSSDYPENTLLSFRKAYEVGADGIELDAKLTTDNVVVIMHDQSVDRTTNGSGIVSEMSSQEIRKLDAGIKKGLAFENEPVPTLKTIFEELGGKIEINVELTNYDTKNKEPLARAVVGLITEFGLEESVIISSFDFGNLALVKAMNPHIQCALLAQKRYRGLIARNVLKHSLNVDALHPHISDVTEKMTRREHQCGRAVRVWTVNEAADIRKMSLMGVDAIFTDNPEFALSCEK